MIWDTFVEQWEDFNNSGKNVHRDFLNLPRFVEILPSNSPGSQGLEIGGGEGTLARVLAEKGYRLLSTDFSPNMIALARKKEAQNPLGIQYAIENAEQLSFSDENFDYVLAFMCLMDLKHPKLAIKEAYRVLKPGGYFQISIIHPCFASQPHHKHIVDANGETIGLEVGRYYDEGIQNVEWNLTETIKVTSFHNHLTLSHWLSLLIETGFRLEYIEEPHADDEIVKLCPHLKHTIIEPDNLLIRVRK